MEIETDAYYTLKWMSENREKRRLLFDDFYDDVFDDYETGGLEEVKKNWLTHNEYISKFINQTPIDVLFCCTCYKGYLDLAKWIYDLALNSNKFKKIKLNVGSNKLFIGCCGENQLEIAKWLLTIEDNEIDIHDRYDCAFKLACARNHLDMAKWLYSLDNNINFRDDNDELFYVCCKSIADKNDETILTCKWLASLCENYYFEYDDKQVKFCIYSMNKMIELKAKKGEIKDECIVCKNNTESMVNLKCNDKHNHCYCTDCIEQMKNNDIKFNKCLICFNDFKYDNMITNINS